MSKGQLVLILLLTGSFSAWSQAVGDAERGKQLYQICTVCHGVQGEGTDFIKAPAIGGMEDWYFVRQINNYKNDIRGYHPDDELGNQMRVMSKNLLADQDVADVAAYLASLPKNDKSKTVDGDPVRGKTLYTPCSGCHGLQGEGKKILNAPSLDVQHDFYMADQLKKFKTGQRGTHDKDLFGKQMRPMAMMLADDKAIDDIVSYINTLTGEAP